MNNQNEKEYVMKKYSECDIKEHYVNVIKSKKKELLQIKPKTFVSSEEIFDSMQNCC